MRGAGRDDLVTVCGPFTVHGMVSVEVIGPRCVCGYQHAYRFTGTDEVWNADRPYLIEAILDVLYNEAYVGLRTCAAAQTVNWRNRI